MIIDLYFVGYIFLILFCIIFLGSNLFFSTVLCALRSRSVRRLENKQASFNSFSIIIPAYNEEKNIENKIETLFDALRRVNSDVDIEVIIGSDGSTDRTVEIASELIKKLDNPNWRLVEFSNEGKCKTINKLVSLARGQIIISTDADIPLPENSINLVVQAFKAERSIGCLSCIPCFKGLNIGSQKSYWHIEDKIRNAESALGKLIVVTGMLYAYRKDLFEPLPHGVMADDLWIPLNILLKGHESIQLQDLLVPYEKTDEKTEILRRKRVIVGGMDVVRRLWPQLLAKPSLFALVYFHKINRWAMPAWLLVLVFATVGLWPWFILVYIVLVLVGLIIFGAEKCLKLAYAGFSPILSFVEIFKNSDFARWEHTRKH